MRRFKSDALQKYARAFDRLEQFGERLQRAWRPTCCSTASARSIRSAKLLESYSFHSVLNRGFALVRDQDGQPVLAAAGTARRPDTISIEFGDGEVGARVSDGTAAGTPRPAAAPRKRDAGGGNQGSLL